MKGATPMPPVTTKLYTFIIAVIKCVDVCDVNLKSRALVTAIQNNQNVRARAPGEKKIKNPVVNSDVNITITIYSPLCWILYGWSPLTV